MSDGRGGYRVGAGRKPTGKRKATFYVTEKEEAHLRQELSKIRIVVLDSKEKLESELQDEIEPPKSKEAPKCPQCKTGYLKVKIGRKGKFIGCTTFPKCHYTENYLGD
jgi:ssDNA-binding Zn-finger/Zn-ribbon topoisomerase 1